MAQRGGDSIFELQRELMAAEVASEGRHIRDLKFSGRSAGGGAPPAANGGRPAGTAAVYDPRRHAVTQHPPVRRPPTGGAREDFHIVSTHRPQGTAAIPAARTPPAGSYRPETIDVKEVQKQMMFGEGSELEDEHFEKNRPAPNAVYGISDQYLVLDSFLKLASSRSHEGEFDFNVMVEGSSRRQSIAVSATLENVIEIQVLGFCIPLLRLDVFDPAVLTAENPGLGILNLAANGALPAGDEITSSRSQIPFCRRVTLHIRNLGRQAFIDRQNKSHQFEFEASIPPTNDRILLTPLSDYSVFQFTDPIKEISAFELRFNNPDNNLVFPPDCYYVVSALSDAGQLLQFDYRDVHGLGNLAVGDRIYIECFASGEGVLDRYIARPEGHLVGAGGFVAPTASTPGSFRLNPDVDVSAFFAAGVAIPSTTSITICIAKNRVRIPLRVRKVVGRLTNYKSP